MRFGRRKRVDDQPTLTDTGFSVEFIAEMARHGHVFDEVVNIADLPPEAQKLLPEELRDILGPGALFKFIDTQD